MKLDIATVGEEKVRMRAPRGPGDANSICYTKTRLQIVPVNISPESGLDTESPRGSCAYYS
jgi:hypothetical protein